MNIIFSKAETLSAVDLKGKRLDYLKAHEIFLNFVAKTKGTLNSNLEYSLSTN